MIVTALIVLGGIGIISSVLLYITSKKFEVYEDPLIGQVQEVLPAANCGGWLSRMCGICLGMCKFRFVGRAALPGWRSGCDEPGGNNIGKGVGEC